MMNGTRKGSWGLWRKGGDTRKNPPTQAVGYMKKKIKEGNFLGNWFVRYRDIT